ncbi:MAG: endonuclease III [Flavobacteriaceae bacterium]
MNLFDDKNWEEKLYPIIEKYKRRKHPLDYQNYYQLIIMVILSARDSDANINKLAKVFFKRYPSFKSISKSTLEELTSHLNKVTNYNSKSNWIHQIAKDLNEDNLPKKLDQFTKLKGIGRKSGNVILREMNLPTEGIICDLHVIRVAPRLGLTSETKDGNKLEKQLMENLPKNIWGDIGMALSFLGRETCRPKPNCHDCILKNVCHYYSTIKHH